MIKNHVTLLHLISHLIEISVFQHYTELQRVKVVPANRLDKSTGTALPADFIQRIIKIVYILTIIYYELVIIKFTLFAKIVLCIELSVIFYLKVTYTAFI